MALGSGFLKQKCQWTRRPSAPGTGASGYDAFGQPTPSAAVTIRCRWEMESGFVGGLMGAGAGKTYNNRVMLDSPVSEGDTLLFTDPKTDRQIGGEVQSVTSIVDVVGREQGRICYV